MNESPLFDCTSREFQRARHQEAVEALDRVLAEIPCCRFQIVDFGECAVVRLRDCLIEGYRSASSAEEAQEIKRDLDQVNIALSLVVGVEYPGAGIQQKPLEQARAVLEGLFL